MTVKKILSFIFLVAILAILVNTPSVYSQQTASTVTKHTPPLTGEITNTTPNFTFAGDKDHIYNIVGNLTLNGNIPGNAASDRTGVIFIDGDPTKGQGNLIINQNYTYGSPTSGTVFVVKGDVRISPTVTRIDAVIISQGTICTADDFTSSICPSANVITTSPLTVNGSLISLNPDKPTSFRRALADNSQAAEVINHQVKYLVILRNLISDTLQKWSEIDANTPIPPPPVACVSNGSCNAAEPACGQTTTGVDNCGKRCSKPGSPCPISPTPPPFNYSLSASLIPGTTNNIIAPQGSGGGTTITATLSSGTTEKVTLSVSNLPTGATASFFNGSFCNPTCSLQLQLNAGTNTPNNTYSVLLTGTSAKGLVKSIPLSFKVVPPSPGIVTKDATDITYKSATLNSTASYTAGGGDLYVWYLWDTVKPKFCSALANITGRTLYTQAQLGSAAGSVNNAFSLSGLSSNTTYYFCATAKNDGGGYVEQNDIHSFQTPKLPPPTVDLKANGSDGPITVDNGSQFTLSWNIIVQTDPNHALNCSGTETYNTSSSNWPLPSYEYADGTYKFIGSGPRNASYQFSPDTYSVTCTNSGGTTTDSVTININPPPLCGSPDFKCVFATKNTYTGDLGGLNGADAKCQDSAKTAGLKGTYKAWISDHQTSAFSRLTHATVPYKTLLYDAIHNRTVPGYLVANNWNDLMNETKPNCSPSSCTTTNDYLRSAIDYTEYGQTDTTVKTSAWTNTDYKGNLVDGTNVSGPACLDWTTGDWDIKPYTYGEVGDVGVKDPSWTNDTALNSRSHSIPRECFNKNHLYCFEQ